eukprot:11211548-Lingulodinium_polyedra.AAC.1
MLAAKEAPVVEGPPTPYPGGLAGEEQSLAPAPAVVEQCAAPAPEEQPLSMEVVQSEEDVSTSAWDVAAGQAS